MPPRRSSRSSTRESVPPPDAPVPAKRKRVKSEVVDSTTTEVAGVISSTRRPTSARSNAVIESTRNRASTRSKPSLKEVTEIVEESDAEHSLPPSKKKRLSEETVVQQEESSDEIEEVEPPPKRRGAVVTGRSGVQKTKRKTKRVESEEEMSETGESRSVVPLRTGSVVPSRKSSRVSTKPMKVEPESTVLSDSDEVRPAAKTRKPRVMKVVDEGESELETPTNKHATTTSRVTRRAVSSQLRQNDVPNVEDPEDPEEASVAVSSTGIVSGSHAVKASRSNLDVYLDDYKADSQSEGPALRSIGQDSKVLDTEVEHSLLDASLVSPSRPRPSPPVEEPKGPQARFVIHKMVLVNFKSYAGRQEIGPFHKSFSAIVGPNGSGKSNTVDALLFVFGYRASKMRQGKLSELIHNSARHPDLQDCSVEIHFREIIDLPGPDAFDIVPNSQLVVSRTAYKNNNSKYTINSRNSTFKEVQALLKGKDIDLDHNRFLILQGEVEAIALMKPKAPSEHEDGLLEYLEDIIGTSRFKEPLEEAFAEMERLAEDRTEKLNRLRITEKEKNALLDKKREAEDYLRLQNEHIRALSRLWQWYLWRCLHNEQEFQKKASRIQRDLDEERDKYKDDVTHQEMLQKHFEERETAYAEIKEAAAEAVKDLAKHEKQQVGLEERLKHSNSKAKKLKKSIQDDERSRNEASRTFESSVTKIEKEKAKVEEYEASLAKEEKVLEEIRDSLKDKTQVFHDQIELKQKELQPWTAKINAKRAEIDISSSERDALVKKAEAAKAATAEALETLESLRRDQEAKTTELEDLKAQKSNLGNQLSSKQQKLQETRSNVQRLRQQASSTRQRADEAKSSQATNRSQNQVLDSLTKLQHSGRISGFHGRLGNLGTIPDKYDVAVTTAAGALNNFVVDTVDQGQACIEYLRKQNIGRASFMVLEKLSKKSIDKLQTPENVPRLFDLINPKEPRFAPAFFKAVGNTLVAEDMTQANRIAYGHQRWRVVTLAGQLIDSSGTMSGGGNHVSRGGMSSKFAADAVSPTVLRQYEQESDDAAAKLEDAVQELRQVEAEIDNLSRSGPQIDTSVQKLNLDLQNVSKRIAEAQKRVSDLKSKSNQDTVENSRISRLESDIASATNVLQELQEKTAKIEEAIEALEKKILDIGGARLLAQKSKVDGLKLHINLANEEITKAEVAKQKAEKDSSKFSKSVESNKESLAEAEKEVEELRGQVEECVQYVMEIRSKVDDAKAAEDNSKEDLEKLKQELDDKTEQVRGFKKKEMELEQKLKTTEKEIDDNTKAVEHWRNEHDKLRLEEIDDDDEEDEETEDVGSRGDPQVKQESSQEVSKKQSNREGSPLHELHTYTVEELQRFKQPDMVADTELLDEKLKNAKPNLSVLKEYRRREEEFLKRAQDFETTTKLRDAQKQHYDSLRKQRLDEFMTGFNTISFKLKEMYQMITLGGNAELELVDSMDPFSEGIIFSVMPPKKSWRNISNLSGGEKTLSSLALVFALHAYKPTPLYFMDEIDAALDFRNVSIVANYIKDRTKNAQFIIISLRNDMFELSHRLIGIYKTANATKSVSIDNFSLNVIPVQAVPA